MYVVGCVCEWTRNVFYVLVPIVSSNVNLDVVLTSGRVGKYIFKVKEGMPHRSKKS